MGESLGSHRHQRQTLHRVQACEWGLGLLLSGVEVPEGRQSQGLLAHLAEANGVDARATRGRAIKAESHDLAAQEVNTRHSPGCAGMDSGLPSALWHARTVQDGG